MNELLARKMNPKSLSDVVGQRHLIGEDKTIGKANLRFIVNNDSNYSFYLFNVNKAQVEVTKTADMTEEIKVFYFNEIKNEPIEINYKIKEDKIQFSVNKPEFPILITSINEYNQLVKRNYVL